MNKYHNRELSTPDGKFDSVHEFTRWQELKLLQRAGEIYDLQRQVPFVLIPKQVDDVTGKVIEREARYVADFTYRDKKTNKLVVEDTKSKATKTKDYILKRKLLLYRHGIRIVEV